MQNKKSFLLYADLRDTLIDFSKSDKADIFDAILDFQNEIQVKLPTHLVPAFAFLKTQFLRDSEKYSKEIEKRKMAGVASGIARKAKSEQNEQTATNRTSVQCAEQNQHIEQTATNPSDSVNVSDIDSVKEPNIIIFPSSNINPPPTPQVQDGVFKEKEGKNNIIGSVDALISMIGDKGIAKARENAKGWDIYHLSSIYLGGMDTRGMPKNLSSAFAGWCKSYTKNKTL